MKKKVASNKPSKYKNKTKQKHKRREIILRRVKLVGIYWLLVIRNKSISRALSLCVAWKNCKREQKGPPPLGEFSLFYS